MLELKDIKKTYETAGETVDALRGINLKFRENEFVSILGPSGCGKTTMLNIIGGLDKYTSGDLVINGTSTKQYNDRDWDAYRNHSIGFVFQNYNLIPHQSVLQNVELALTLAGVSSAERRKRAKEALEKVGLGNQLKKRPSQMSGGQMQRVAIARAIVNNPDIILADEPTGALDTETSIQVMDILKEIAKDRLVIMVTHNPDLAEQYSTRIVRMLDGQILSDSMPLTDEEYATQLKSGEEKQAASKKTKKPSMSFFTSFGLSLKNLFTKKGRTILTSFAGSIGIIGIALIYAVSQGTTNYISAVQEETLASYPLQIESTNISLASLITSFAGKAESLEKHDNDAVYQKAMIYEMINALSTVEEKKNDLKSFKKYIEEQMEIEGSKINSSISAVKYSYGINLTVYTKDPEGTIVLSDSQKLLSTLIRKYMGSNISAGGSGSAMGGGMSLMMMGGGSTNLWRELIPGEKGKLVSEVTQNQYQLVYGSWPTSYDQVVIFVDENNEIDDLTLYALGLKTEEDIAAILKAAMNKEEIDYEAQHWSFEEICNLEFKTVLDSDGYVYDELTKTFSDLRDTESGLKMLYDNGLKLKVVGIVKPAEGSVSGNIDSGIGYTSKLTEYIIKQADESEAVKAQKANPDRDIFTNLPFKSGTDGMAVSEKAAAFKAYVEKLEEAEKAMAYIKILSIPSEEEMAKFVEMSLGQYDREQMEATIVQAMKTQTGMDEATLAGYLKGMSDEEVKDSFKKLLEEQYKMQHIQAVTKQTAGMTPAQLAAAFDMAVTGYTDEQCATYYTEVLTFSSSSYEANMKKLGSVDLDTPTGINLFSKTFAAKDEVKEAIAEYNKSVNDELKEISYTDYIGLMLSSITTIINAITYVLIAFVAVSLIVSSIMIGVITLISVQERTKEIGILRAIGASKKNVSGMFNAETVIIGFTSGALGVIITWLLCIPINLILHSLTGIMTLSAVLPISAAIVLIVISMLLTLIAGIIPSRSAAKKDPVVALRTE